MFPRGVPGTGSDVLLHIKLPIENGWIALQIAGSAENRVLENNK
jgi:hypothetical protein